MPREEFAVCFYCADQNPHRDRSRGITHYTYQLMSHMRDLAGFRLRAVVSKSSMPVPEGVERIVLPFASDRTGGRLLADHLHPLLTRSHGAALWHYPKGFLPLGPQVAAPRVGTVPDVMLQQDADLHPESRPPGAFAYWLKVLKHSIARLDLILTITEFSRRDILRFCDRHRLTAPPIVLTYLGVAVADPTPAPGKEDYVLHLASHLPHKATGWLLEQWAALATRGNSLPELRLVGTLDPAAAARVAGMKGVSLTPPLPRAELESAMASARALLLPSEIEGFGIPAVESYLLGTPVAYARGTAVEEVLGGNAPGGFERNLDALAAALDEVLSLDSAEVAALGVELGERYTWEKCVQRTIEAYRTQV